MEKINDASNVPVVSLPELQEFLLENFVAERKPSQGKNILSCTEDEAIAENARLKVVFQKTVQDMEGATGVLTVDPCGFCICSLKQFMGPAGLTCRLLVSPPSLIQESNLYKKDTALYNDGDNMVTLSKKDMCVLLKVSLSQMNELVERGYLFKYEDIEEKRIMTFIPSKKFLTYLCKKNGIPADKEGYDPFRDLFLGSRLKRVEPFSILYRENSKGRRKAFSCYSAGFRPLKHSVLIGNMDEINRSRPVLIMGWKFTHFLAYLDLVFVEDIVNDEFAIGCRIAFSDTGEASLQFNILAFFEGYTFPVGKRCKSVQELLEKAERMCPAYKGIFDRCPSIKVPERAFVTDALTKEGEPFALGRVTVRKLVEKEAQNGTPFKESVLCVDAMKHILRMAHLAPGEAPTTQIRLFEALGSFFETH